MLQHFWTFFKAWAASNKAPLEACADLAMETVGAMAHVPPPLVDMVVPALEGVIASNHAHPAVPSADGSGIFASGPCTNGTHAVAVALDTVSKIVGAIPDLNATGKGITSTVEQVASLFIPNPTAGQS